MAESGAKHLIAVCLGLYLCLTAAPVLAQGELVVISVTGQVPDVREGQVVLPGKAVSLPPAASVRLLSASGKVIVLSGPYAGPFAAAEAAQSADGGSQEVNRLAKFLTERQKAMSTLGTMRTASAPLNLRDPTDPWQVVISENGPQCARPAKVELWRKEARSHEILTLRSQDGATAKFPWPTGENGLELANEFVLDGQTLQAAIGSRTSAIRLFLLPSAISNPVETANWLIEKGCTRQSRLYLDSLP